MELIGHVIEAKRFERLGTGDESSSEALAELHHDELLALDGRLRLPEGSSEASLRTWVMEGRGVGRPARSVLELVLGCTRRDRLEDDAWSPVRASALDDLDAALQEYGLPRNATLRKLARPTCGAAGRSLVLDDGLVRTLSGLDHHAAEPLWSAAVARLTGDELARARVLLRWWGLTLRRRAESYARGNEASFVLLLVLS